MFYAILSQPSKKSRKLQAMFSEILSQPSERSQRPRACSLGMCHVALTVRYRDRKTTQQFSKSVVNACVPSSLRGGRHIPEAKFEDNIPEAKVLDFPAISDLCYCTALILSLMRNGMVCHSNFFGHCVRHALPCREHVIKLYLRDGLSFSNLFGHCVRHALPCREHVKLYLRQNASYRNRQASHSH